MGKESGGSESVTPNPSHTIAPGARFGKLACLERTTAEAYGMSTAAWRCRCACGNEIVVRESLLRCKVRRSCGCTKSRARDLSNMEFGRLTALEPVPQRDVDFSIRWLCRCSCGEYIVVSSNKLLMGHTQSCGCYGDEVRGDGRTFVDGTCLEIIASEKLPRNNTSGHKGVSRYRNRNQWAAYITYAGKQYSIGRYDSIDRAVAVREGAERLRLEFVQQKLDGECADRSFADVLQEYLRTEREAWSPPPEKIYILLHRKAA